MQKEIQKLEKKYDIIFDGVWRAREFHQKFDGVWREFHQFTCNRTHGTFLAETLADVPKRAGEMRKRFGVEI